MRAARHSGVEMMKQKLNPLAAAVIILAAAGIIYAIMWRASEAPKANHPPPPPLALGPPGMAAAAPHKGHPTHPPAAGHGTATHPEKAKSLASPKGSAGSAEK